MRHVRVHISLPTKAAPRSTPIYGDAIRFYVQLSRKLKRTAPLRRLQIYAFRSFSQHFASQKRQKTPFLAGFYAFPHRLSAHFGACAGEISKFPTSLFVSMQSLCPSKWPLSGRNVATFGAESGHVRGRGSAEASQGSASSPSVMRTAWLKRHCLCREHRVKVGSIN